MAQTFYVAVTDSNRGSPTYGETIGYVAATYLTASNGQPVPAGLLSQATSITLYSNSDGTGAFQNTNGYLIVPANYTIADAISQAQTYQNLISSQGQIAAITQLGVDYKTGGLYDLQRNDLGVEYTSPSGAVYNSSDIFIAAFRPIASWQFGFAAAYGGIGTLTALFGAGGQNDLNTLKQVLSNGSSNIDASGYDNNNPRNVVEITNGSSFASTLSGSANYNDGPANIETINGGPNDTFSTATIYTNSITNTSSAIIVNTDGSYSFKTIIPPSEYYIGSNAGSEVTISNIVLTGVQSAQFNSDGSASFTDGSGNSYTLYALNDQNQAYHLVSSNGKINLILNPTVLSTVDVGSVVTVSNTLGDTVTLSASTGLGTLGFAGTTQTINAPSTIEVDTCTFGVLPNTRTDGLGTDYNITPSGATNGSQQGFLGLPDDLTFAQTQTAASAVSSDLSSAYTSYTATSAAVNTDIFGSVSPLGSGYGAGGITLADGTDQNYVPGDLVDTGAGLYVEMPIANSLGLFNSAPTNVATDNLQISQGRYMVASQNDPYIIDQQSPYIGGIAFAQTASGLANGANLTADTDPLLIDLTGNGIQVSNWIDNDVYFQSNVTTSGSTESEDTSLHHTSWMGSGTGMLVFDPGDTAITNITQTVSEYLNISSNATAVGSYADGLAALSALATAGSSVFSAATSKTDPNTGVKYWNEIYVATGAPSATGAIPASQLETLSAAEKRLVHTNACIPKMALENNFRMC